MLKNQKLLGLLTSPDHPDGEPLKLDHNCLIHDPWPVPIVAGIPDFVTHAPPTHRTLTMKIPMDDEPSPAVFIPPRPLEKPPVWFREARYKYPLLKEHCKGFLLDAGCGQGNRCTFEGLGYDYIGLDISPNSQQSHKGSADLDIMADCHRLPLPSDAIEIINCSAVLEHLYWPALAVREFYRVLKPGGVLLGSCSFLEAEHFDSQYHHSWLGLYRLLGFAGFDVKYIHPGLSLWEMHAGSIFLGVPGHKFLGKLLCKIYLMLVGLKGKESPQQRLLKHAAILHFAAAKV
jgi:SAM-dependent methyltransferase